MVWPFSSSTSGENSQSSDSPADSKTHRLKQAQDRALEKAATEAQRRKLVDAVNENCALEGAALFECQESWNLRNRLTLCQTFQKGYMDCMNAQRALLTQLGYGMPGNTEEEDELIKWHADELYQKSQRDKELAEKEKASSKDT